MRYFPRPAWWGYLLGLLLILTAIPSYAQSGWTRAQGEGFVQLSWGGFSSDRYYNLEGDLVQTAAFRQGYVGVFGEYGLKPRWTLMVNWPAFKVQGFSTTETVAGLGDVVLGVKYGILRGKFPLTFTLAPEIPSGPANLFAQNTERTFETINLPTGDGELNLHGILALSHSFYPAPVYANAHIAYNLRTQYEGRPFQDQVQGGLEVGVKFWSHFWLQLRIKGQVSLGDQPRLTDFVRGEGTTFTAWSPSLVWELTQDWSLALNYQGYLSWPIPRRNLYDARVLSLGVSYTWKPE